MRDHERHAAAHFVINHSICLVPDNAEERATGRSLLDYRAGDIGPAVRPRPLAIKATATKFVVWHEISSADDPFGTDRPLSRRRIEIRIALRIGLQDLRGSTDIAVELFGHDLRMFQKKSAQLTASEIGDLVENL